MTETHLSVLVFERFLAKVLKIIGPFFVACFVFYFLILSRGEVNGSSMQPNFVDQEHFLINKILYLVTTPQRFDVVQIIEPNKEKYIIKRVIGMPGETVTIKDGKIFLTFAFENTKTTTTIQLDESRYLPTGISTKPAFGLDPYKSQSITATNNEYIVLGDNRNNSTDSRVYGPIPRSQIIGKVIQY